MKLIAEFPDAQFWHGDSIESSEASPGWLAVTDPPMECASTFHMAMDWIDEFIVFAGLKKHAPTIARKIIACGELLSPDPDIYVNLHQFRDLNDVHYAISSSGVMNMPEVPWIYDKECPDCLDHSYIKWVIEDLLGSSIDSFDAIYDPFCGDGSTALAALSLGKKFVGIDLDLSRVTEAARKYGEALHGN